MRYTGERRPGVAKPCERCGHPKTWHRQTMATAGRRVFRECALPCECREYVKEAGE